MYADKSEAARPPTLYLVKRLLAHHKRACRALVRHNRRGGYRFLDKPYTPGTTMHHPS